MTYNVFAGTLNLSISE